MSTKDDTVTIDRKLLDCLCMATSALVRVCGQNQDECHSINHQDEEEYEEYIAILRASREVNNVKQYRKEQREQRLKFAEQMIKRVKEETIEDEQTKITTDEQMLIDDITEEMYNKYFPLVQYKNEAEFNWTFPSEGIKEQETIKQLITNQFIKHKEKQMIPSDTQVTEEMIKAGEDIETQMRIAQTNKRWKEYKNGDSPNKDIVIEHIENNMTKVEAIYRAMERARKIGYPQPTTCMHHPV